MGRQMGRYFLKPSMLDAHFSKSLAWPANSRWYTTR
uniref:Uncharacterized protein n=1 Tax=Triticum urartu TaxID=4572 RepID=A0A8R7QIY1_TRIUA